MKATRENNTRTPTDASAGSRTKRTSTTRATKAGTQKSAGKANKPKGHDDRDASQSRSKEWTQSLSKTRVVEAASHGTDEGLEPFASYYTEVIARPIPLDDGKTIETLDRAQLEVLRDLFWSLPMNSTTDDLIEAASKHKIFKAREKPVRRNHINDMMRQMRDVFPWSMKVRRSVVASYHFINKLLTTAEEVNVGTVLEELEAEHNGFLSWQNVREQEPRWRKDTDSYPFAQRLPKRAKKYDLSCHGKSQGISYDVRGRLRRNEALVNVINKVSQWVRYDWELDDLVDAVNGELPNGGFNRSAFHAFLSEGKVVEFTTTKNIALEEVATLIWNYHVEDGMVHAAAIMKRLHEEHDYPLWDTGMLSHFRDSYPWIPMFKEARLDKNQRNARLMIDAIKAEPGVPFTQLGERIGLNPVDFKRAMYAARAYYGDELPDNSWHPYTDDDREMLRTAKDLLSSRPTLKELEQVVRTHFPEFIERHDLNTTRSWSLAAQEIGIKSWSEFQRERWTRTFVDIAAKVERGTPLAHIARFMLDENPRTYHPGWVTALSRKWRKNPDKYPPIGELLDSAGKFPWEYYGVKRTKTNARKIRKAIQDNPGQTIAWYCNELNRLNGGGQRFTPHVISSMRARYPGIVPYTDDLTDNERAARMKRRQTQHHEVGDHIVKAVKGLDEPSGATVTWLERETGFHRGKIVAALQADPERFSWYRQPAVGTTDLYLATRVAYEMEEAPLGTTLQDVIDTMRADPAFVDAYPVFSVNSFQHLRSQYPDIVGSWNSRNQILATKLLTDAVLTAARGTSFEDIISGLRERYPGGFPAAYDRPDYLRDTWANEPKKFPFLDALRDKRGHIRLVGRGKTLPAEEESSSQLAARLARLEKIPRTLPLLDKLSEDIPSTTFDNCEVIAIQHMLDSQVPTFETYRKLGMSRNRTSIVAVPYSASQAVIDALEAKGWDVSSPPLELDAWFKDVKRVMLERIASASKSGRRIIVLDDGGLTTKLLATDPELKKHAHMFRIVEQTRRGITVADGVDLNAPVVNVAQSWGKYVEGPMIGGSVEDKLLARLEKLGIDPANVAGKRIGIVGLGTIGEPIARALQALGAIITVDDIGAKAKRRARKLDMNVAGDRDEFLGGQDIIIGCTGVNSITAEDLEKIPDGCIIGSASSKLVEIDVEALADMSRGRDGKVRMKVIDNESHPPTVEYTLKGGRKIRLLARGFPINFDGGAENIPAEHIQLTRGLMLIGALQAVGVKVPGVHRLIPDLQIEALREFSDLELDSLDQEQREALSLAQLQLQENEYRRHSDR